MDPDATSFLVACIDGRGFGRMLRRRPEVESSLDLRIRDVMIATADQLMNCSLRISYAHTHSDKISLLLHRDEARDRSELVSILAGEASAKFTLLIGELACFTCRLHTLPDADSVVDYFGERQVDAERCAIVAQGELAMRRAGEGASARFQDLDATRQRMLLRELDLASLPIWQRRGVGLRWMQLQPLQPLQPVHGQASPPLRRVRVELELPAGDDYEEFLRERVAEATAGERSAS